ncbi:hypothetical protein ACFVSN_26815 [Kitasatospora sp. NPDC057904]|uniref:hypothetical protein n=1 Tax=unclassified Kitasatospora TaxID=2633591 RepID=UPI0036D98DDE
MTDRGLLRLLTVLLAALMSVGALAAPAALADSPTVHAPNGPPDSPSKEWLSQWNDRSDSSIGVDKDNHWCMMPEADNCRPYKKPDLYDKCEESGNADERKKACDDPNITAARKQRELDKLKDWEATTDHGIAGYQKYVDAMGKCIEGGMNFQDCNVHNADLLIPSGGLGDWVAGKISKLAADAMREIAGYIGEGTVWLLQQFADAFNDASTINLGGTGISHMTGIMTVLSVVIATFLMLIQFGKVAVSQQGAPLATVLKGLGKYALVLGVYAGSAQIILRWIDQVSIWIIDQSFTQVGPEHQDAATVMKTKLAGMFAGLVTAGGAQSVGASLVTGEGVLSQAVGVVIVLGILAILVVGALWIEVLMRQAGIMVLMVAMPVAVAGQLSDETQEWWPKARRAFTAMALAKLAIVVCFGIGFEAMGTASGIRNVIVGLIVFLLAAVAWPVLARFLTMVEAGGGNSVAAGMISSVGSTMGAAFGGFAGGAAGVAGAGAVGGGSGFTKALEEDSASASGSGSNSRSRKFLSGMGSGIGTGIGLGLQLAAAGASTLEGAAANTAANAGLGAPGNGHASVVPPRKGGGGAAPAVQQDAQGSDADTPAETQGPAPQGTGEAEVPQPAASAGTTPTLVDASPPTLVDTSPPTSTGTVRLTTGPVRPAAPTESAPPPPTTPLPKPKGD